MKNWTMIFIGLGLSFVIAGLSMFTFEFHHRTEVFAGNAVKIKGNVKVRAANSSSLHAMRTSQSIYFEDLVETDSKSEAFLMLETGEKLRVLENTDVRVLRDDRGPFVSVLRGLIEPDAANVTAIRIYDGSELIHTFEIDKEKKTTVKQPIDSQDLSIKQPNLSEVGLNETSKGNSSSTRLEDIKKVSTEYPQPRSESVLFYRILTEVEIRPLPKCLIPCRFEVVSSMQGRLFSKDLDRGQIPNFKFVVNTQRLYERVGWVLRTSESELKGAFELVPYSKTLFQKSIRDGKTVDILN